MVVLDVLDEVGQRGEVESAAPEAAGVGEEGGGGDACHGATSESPPESALRAPRAEAEGGAGEGAGAGRAARARDGGEGARGGAQRRASGRQREAAGARGGGGEDSAPGRRDQARAGSCAAPTSATQASPGSARLQLHVPGPALRGARCPPSAWSLLGLRALHS